MLTRAYAAGVRAAWAKLAGMGGMVDAPHAGWFLEPSSRLDLRSVATGVNQGFAFNDSHFQDPSSMTMPPAHVEGDHYRSGGSSLGNETTKSAYERGKLAAVASVNPSTQSAAAIKPSAPSTTAAKPVSGTQPMKLPGAKVAPNPSGAQQVPAAPPTPSATNPASLLGQSVSAGQVAQTAATPTRLTSPLPMPTTLGTPSAAPGPVAAPAAAMGGARPATPPPSPGMTRHAGFSFNLTPRTNSDPIKADNNSHSVQTNFAPPHIDHDAIGSAFDALRMPKNTDSVEAGGSIAQGPGI